MIETIFDLRKIDKEISEDFDKAISHLHFLLFESDYKHTAEICFMYMNSTDSLKNSILICAENDDIYSACVLYRSINEHYLRFKYFFLNYSIQKKDSYALLFRTSLDFVEKRSFLNAVKSARDIKKQVAKTSDEIWEELFQSNKSFENITKNEVVEFSKSLSIKNILGYLESTFKNDDFEEDTFLQEMIVEYSLLSSFVHGGLHAHKELIKVEMSDNRQKIYLDICGPALQIATSIKITSYLILHHAKADFLEMYFNSHKLFEKIKKTI
ncbi:MAG: DUF5677 domain-containing protein [Flavobacteriales bacterium]|nr:DUF5677 domain-containing protein [Flavobacteriales bacterium]